MTPNVRRIGVLALAATLFGTFDRASAQQFHCDQLKEIISVVAEDSTLASIRGPLEKIDTTGKTKDRDYKSLKSLWQPDGYSMMSDYISFKGATQAYTFNSFFDDGSEGKELTKKVINTMRNCLGSDWIYKVEDSHFADSIYYLKNTSNHVVIRIMSVTGVNIMCYKDKSEGDCKMGDCNTYLGSKEYFNEDVYNGTFLDGEINGMGFIKWYADKTGYMGSFIDNEIAGYGSMLDAHNQVTTSGVFFKGELVKIDTAKEGCQFGNCQTGFGLSVIKGGFYVGNYKDGLCDGLGELVSKGGAFYGYFQKNQLNGKGILINAKGEYTFATFTNGHMVGNYETDFADRTMLLVNADNGSTNSFDTDNMLIKKGVLSPNGGITELTGVDYLNLKNFIKSLKDAYGYRAVSYRGIMGEKMPLPEDKSNKIKSMLATRYKCSLLFLNQYKTMIGIDINSHYYIITDFTDLGSDKTAWINAYNKYHDMLIKVLGRRWKVETDEGKLGPQYHVSRLFFRNSFDDENFIKLTADQKGVIMEIH